MSGQNHRSLERALDILELVSKEKDGMSLGEICSTLDLPKSSVFPLVHTLANRKYLNLDKGRNKFGIGLKLFEVGSSYLENTNFYAEVRKIVSDISKECNETVHLAMLDGTEVVYVLKMEGNQPIRMASSIGKRLPAHATAIGKALLSGFDEDGIRRLYSGLTLQKITGKTITDIEVLCEQIKCIKKKGYADESEESTENICCVAAPIRNRYGEVSAAISIAAPVFRVNEEGLSRFRELVIGGAAEIEKILRNVEGFLFY